jgi:hypothetical protein
MSTIKTEHPEYGTHYWSYNPDDQKGMEGEFIKVFPISGGFAKRIPKAHVKEWDTQIPRVYERRFVGFADWPEYRAIACYVNPFDNWNGWAKPLVDEKGRNFFLAEQRRLSADNESVATGKVFNDAIIWHDPNCSDEPDLTIIPEWITVDGIDVKVWDISLGFCWDVQSPRRFIFLLPCNREQIPDLPEPSGGQLVLWDRQEKREVFVLFENYANAICLEQGKDSPFTQLETWFNNLSNEALVSEGMTATKEEFHHA